MKVGITYDLKESVTTREGQPEDALEEYDSPKTIQLITAALESAGHSVVPLGGGGHFLSNIQAAQVDIVFNIAEGRGNYRSREAQVPCVLEMLDIPYSGSDPECLAVCLDKPLAKQISAAAGVVTPKWLSVADKSDLLNVSRYNIVFPAIVKPAWEGSSKGVHRKSVVTGLSEAVEMTEELLGSYRQPVMIEEFIAGDEVTVGLIGNSPPRVFGMMRIVPRQPSNRFVYSVEVKRDWQAQVDYEAPPSLPAAVLKGISSASLTAFKVLGCRDFARLDFRVDAAGTPYFLEINPLPGLGDYSDLVIMALKLGWRYEALINGVLDAAVARYRK